MEQFFVPKELFLPQRVNGSILTLFRENMRFDGAVRIIPEDCV